MLGERIANLRKERKVSQEELADVLNTSRQAISKWEREESDPDIDRLKDLAIYFGVSIDYLLGYDLESVSVNNFIERIKENIETKKLDISVDEIKLMVSKNGNNFVLLCYVSMYLEDYYGNKHESEVNDLIIEISKKAIAAYQVDNPFNASLNDIYKLVASCYINADKYGLVKEYLKENKVYDAADLLSKCELELGNNKEAEKIISEHFLSSISSILNSSFVQIVIHLRNYKYTDALELANWTIDFTISIGRSEEALVDIIFSLTFIKAMCEKILGLGYEREYAFLKDNYQKVLGYRHLKNGLRFFNEQDITFATYSGEIKQDLLQEIGRIKSDKQAYSKAIELYKDIFEE